MDHPPAYDCDEAFRRVHDYVDRELSRGELRLVREHLERCARCAREFRFEAAVLADLKRKLRRIPVPGSLARRIDAAIEAARRR